MVFDYELERPLKIAKFNDEHHERDYKITKCNNEHNRDWSSLPLDILRDISSRLIIFDHYSFANVCTSWRTAKAPLSRQLPFLFLRKIHFNPKPFCKLLNLANDLSDNVHMPILGGKDSIGSQYGWLTLIDHKVAAISLYNPFSHQEIKLPSHSHVVTWLAPDNSHLLHPDFDFVSRKFPVVKVVLLRAPTSTAPFPAAAALFRGEQLMYKRDGEYGWELLPRFFQNITSWRGMFFVIAREGDVYKLDPDVPEPEFEFMGIGSYEATCLRYNKHLVNLNDNLLQVWWHIDRERTITVKVMQLDLQPHTWIPVELLWTPVDDLCGHSLFLSTSHSLSLSSQHIPGQKDNLIYFIQDEYNYPKRGIAVFNMRNGTYETCKLQNTPFAPSTSVFWYAPPLYELRNQSF